MESSCIPINTVIVGDVVLNEARGPMLVLAIEPAPGDRTRLTLLLEDGSRVRRTYPKTRKLTVQPLGAELVLKRSFHLRVSAGRFLGLHG